MPKNGQDPRVVRNRELTSGEIAARFRDVTGPAISQHLRVRLDAGLVSVRRQGTRRLYRARPEGLHGLREYLEEFWRASQATLAEEAEIEEKRKRHGSNPERN